MAYTSSHGLSIAFKAKNLIGRVLWTIVYIAAGIYCIHEFQNLIRNFLRYDVLVHVRLSRTTEVPFPAVTVCNINAFRSSAISKSPALATVNEASKRIMNGEKALNSTATTVKEALGNVFNQTAEVVDTVTDTVDNVGDTVNETAKLVGDVAAAATGAVAGAAGTSLGKRSIRQALDMLVSRLNPSGVQSQAVDLAKAALLQRMQTDYKAPPACAFGMIKFIFGNAGQSCSEACSQWDLKCNSTFVSWTSSEIVREVMEEFSGLQGTPCIFKSAPRTSKVEPGQTLSVKNIFECSGWERGLTETKCDAKKSYYRRLCTCEGKHDVALMSYCLNNPEIAQSNRYRFKRAGSSSTVPATDAATTTTAPPTTAAPTTAAPTTAPPITAAPTTAAKTTTTTPKPTTTTKPKATIVDGISTFLYADGGPSGQDCDAACTSQGMTCVFDKMISMSNNDRKNLVKDLATANGMECDSGPHAASGDGYLPYQYFNGVCYYYRFGDASECSKSKPYASRLCECQPIPTTTLPPTTTSACWTSDFCNGNGDCYVTSGLVEACNCQPGWEGTNCSQNIDECASNPCNAAATCVDGVAEYTCTCPTGYTGTLCNDDPPSCWADPCVNGACSVSNHQQICDCTNTGYTGTTCEIELNECASSPCDPAATCVDDVNSFSCTCPENGYEGDLCKDDPPKCWADPCVYGTCYVSNHTQLCDCTDTGFEGPLCQTEIDECASNPCNPVATCTDAFKDYSCACPQGYYGPECNDDPPVCWNLLYCTPKGTCSVSNHTQVCTCLPGYTGTLCETEINECDSNPCNPAATCEDYINYYTCQCPVSHAGLTCDDDPPLCWTPAYCSGTGICSVKDHVQVCACFPGYTGTQCEINIDECGSNPCNPVATCHDSINMYTCSCPQSHAGLHCNEDPLVCWNTAYCQHGTCSVGNHTQICDCDRGYTGVRCETDIDECISSPCHPAGTCVNLVGMYRCDCPPSHAGERCYLDPEHCWNLPHCEHGSCYVRNHTQWCSCDPGYSGDICNINIDECASSPCNPASTCVDGINGYECDCPITHTGITCNEDPANCWNKAYCQNGDCHVSNHTQWCTCYPGYDGVNCEIDIDECASSPCNPAATCEDQVNSYICNCPETHAGSHCNEDPKNCWNSDYCKMGTCSVGNHTQWCTCQAGYSGVTCDIDIDECASSPCNPASTCIDQVNGYVCDCPPSHTGTHCNEDPKICWELATYCENGACWVQNHTQWCTCQAGYDGVHCEIDIDECASSPCNAAATCKDKVNGYTCLCPPSHAGVYCNEDPKSCWIKDYCDHGECKVSNHAMYCICEPGWKNELCDTDINECTETATPGNTMCHNTATCVNLLNKFECSCAPGYTGKYCDENIDECASAPCNALSEICSDYINGYACVSQSQVQEMMKLIQMQAGSSSSDVFGGDDDDKPTDGSAIAMAMKMAAEMMASTENTTVLEEIGYSLESLFVWCELEENYDCSAIFDTTFYDPSFGNCYVFNQQANIEDRYVIYQAGREHGLRFQAAVNTDDYMQYEMSSGVKMVVKKPGEPVFPDKEGFIVSPGQLTSIRLSYYTVYKLPPPYGTCIRNGSTLKHFYYQNQNYSLLGCERSLVQSRFVDFCNCSHPRYPQKPGVALCGQRSFVCLGEYEYEANNITSSLRKHCPEPCDEELFEITASKSDWPALLSPIRGCNLTDTDCREKYRKKYGVVEIYYQDLSVWHYVETEKETLVSLISDMGSIMGVAVGMSAISILELLYWISTGCRPLRKPDSEF